MSGKAKTNLLVAVMVIGTWLAAVFHVPMWAIVLGCLALLVLAAVYAVVTSAKQQSAELEQYQSARQLLRRGDMQAAVDKLLHVRADDSPSSDPRLGLMVDLELALGYALLGDLDSARWALAQADAKAGEQTRVYQAHSALVRAAIDCRHDQCTEAARHLDDIWPACEAELTGAQLRPLRIVRAFAVSAGGAHAGGSPETALATVRPAFAGEHDYLGKAWPEMARYLADNGLSK